MHISNNILTIKKYISRSLKSYIRYHYYSSKYGVSKGYCGLFNKKVAGKFFILGNGASVNTYSTKEWNEIKNETSIGVNNWVYHDVIPNYYVFESNSLDKDFFKCFHIKKEQYSNTTIIMKDIENITSKSLSEYLSAIPDALRMNFTLSIDFGYPCSSIEQYKKQLTIMEKFGLFSSHCSPIPRKKASIIYAVTLGLKMGYKEIILCGVDLNTTEYFYDKERNNLAKKGYWVQPDSTEGNVHNTINPNLGELTFDKFIYAFSEVVLNDHQARLYVAKESSALHPHFPSYFS